jgi:hypothetical protein
VIGLAKLQRWFQDETLRPCSLPARRRPRGAVAVERVILPSRTLAAHARLELYAGMYFMRLHDALADDYKVVRELLGPARFERLARAYLTRFPSVHYSLNLLGAKLPEFLEGPVAIPRRALIRDVARVELAMAQVFDEAPSPALDPKALEAIPPAKWATARLRVAHALRLLELDHPANALVTAVRQEKPRPRTPRLKSWVAVYRKDFQVWRMDLSEPMFVALSALAKGKTIPAAIKAASRVFDGSREELEVSVFRWFADWRNEGLFQAVVVRAAPVRRRPTSRSRRRSS